MTPREKAEELFDKYAFVEIANYTSEFEVKQCALIAVNEMLDILNQLTLEYEYWQEVKQEIQKL